MMKSINLAFLKNLSVFSLPIFLLFFMISFYRVAGSIPLVFIGLSFIIYSIKSKKIQFKIQNNNFLKLTSLYFFISLLSLILFENYNETLVKLELKISIILVPYLIFFFIEHFKVKVRQLFIISIIGNTISLIMLLLNATIKYKELGSKAFLYTDLVGDFMMSPIIYSSILNINILSVFYIFKPTLTKNFYLKYLLIAFLSVGVILTSSKIGIIILVINLIIFILIELKQNLTTGLKLLIPIIIFISVFSFTPQFDKLFERFATTSYYLEKRANPDMNQRFPRAIIWESSFHIIKNNFFKGVGVANTNKELHKRYTEIRFGKGMKKHLNAHNQFIETFLASGIFGFLSLLAVFVYLFKNAIKNKDKHFLHVLITITLYCLIESYFESQMGLYIFIMFGSLFLLKKNNKFSKL